MAAMGLVLSLVAFVALGCGGSAHGTHLLFWALGREGEVVQSLIPEFERENPGVRVEVQQIPWTAAHEKLLTAYVGRSTPDLSQLGNTWIPELVALDALEPLGARLARSHIKVSGFFPGIWATNEIGGEPYGVPWYVDTRLLFYRSDLLARAGAARPPRSWAEWHDDMRRLVALPGPDHYAILLPIDEWAQPVVLALEAGAHLLGDGGCYGDFLEPRFRSAFEFYVSLFREHLAPPLGNAQVANLYEQFAAGYFAMVITGPWNLGEFRSRLAPEFQTDWATAPMPAVELADYPGVSLAGGSSLVVFKASNHRDDAFRLIEFLSEPAQQARFYELTGDLPAHTAAWEDPRLAADPRLQAFRDQLRHVRPMPQVPEWERIATAIAEAAERVILGRQTVDQSLAQLQREVDAMLAKRRSLLARAAKGVSR
jgi:multiple sugar transport system substrate-binding protein